MTTGVGAQAPYSICPPPKKAMSSLPQQEKRKANNRYINNINSVARKVLWLIYSKRNERLSRGGAHPKAQSAQLKSAGWGS
jgi:hypothetical protein